MKRVITTTSGKKPIATLKFEVSQSIIENATRCNQNKCMVAEALQEKYPDATYIFVDSSRIAFTRDGVRYWFLPSQSVKQYIMDFDNKKRVKPFTVSTNMLARCVPSGFYQTHPKGDNRTNPGKRYKPENKKRKYGKRVRVNGVTLYEACPV